MKYLVFLIVIFTGTTFGFSTESPKVFFYSSENNSNTVFLQHENDIALYYDSAEMFKPKHKKLKAIILAVFLGHFGVHRIYLGANANVPVVYSLTLGGGFGLLPFIDIINILGTKDLSKFENNDKVIMWVK